MQIQRETTEVCNNYRSALLIQIPRGNAQVQVSLQVLNDHIFLQSFIPNNVGRFRQVFTKNKNKNQGRAFIVTEDANFSQFFGHNKVFPQV